MLCCRAKKFLMGFKGQLFSQHIRRRIPSCTVGVNTYRTSQLSHYRASPLRGGTSSREEEGTQSNIGGEDPPMIAKVPWWKRPHVANIPNALTASRIIATPGLGWLIGAGHYEWACGGLLVFGFSDWLDGYIARKFDQKTVLGSLLDPLADKVLIVTVTAMEGYAGLLPLPLVALILTRDVGLVAGGFWYRAKTKPPDVPFFDTTSSSAVTVEPTRVSKINTAAQISLLASALTNSVWMFPAPEVIDVLCYAVGGLTFISGAQYVTNRNMRRVKKK
eukprot:g3130.t1